MILIAEDNADLRETLAEAAADWGYRVLEVRNGAAALTELERLLAEGSALPALVLADLHMPIVDGPTLLAELQARPGLRDVKTVLVTGDAHAAAEFEESPGVLQVLIKPFSLDELRALLDRAAGRPRGK